MDFTHSWKSVLITGLCLFNLSLADLRAQDADNDGAASSPPTTGGVVGKPPPEEPKNWYPRLSELVMDKSEGDTFVLGNAEYSSRELFVSFFARATRDQVGNALELFPTDAIRLSEDGSSYYMTLSDPNDLFAAVDAYNDLPEVRSAHLIKVDMDRNFAGSPIGPTSGPPQETDSASAQESMFPGDVDGDFTWRVNDATRILRAAIGLTDLSGLAFARADVNRNLKIDIGDATLTLGLVVGKSLPAPYGYTR